MVVVGLILNDSGTYLGPTIIGIDIVSLTTYTRTLVDL